MNERRYGYWSGDRNGRREDKKLCIAEVAQRGAWYTTQCCRPRGHGPDGLYCRQHARLVANGQRVPTGEQR